VLRAQTQRTISGTVHSSDGEELAGATVLITGTKYATITDCQGTFKIIADESNLSSKAALQVSFIGFKTYSIPLSKVRPVVKVTLDSDNRLLDDVVVTGYATLTKERATGALGTLSAKKIDAKLGADLSSRLEGQISGLVLDKDGNLSIRGRATLNAETNPLIVVDGYPTELSIDDLNSDNIENITILKDAVAASIYGSRSANGVIVVTTKSGHEGKTKLSYRGSFMVKPKTDLDYLHLASTSDYIDAELALYDKYPTSSTYNIGSTNTNTSQVENLLALRKSGMISDSEFDSQISSLRQNNVLNDIKKYMLRNALTQTHNVGISGGSTTNRYNLAVNYTGNKESFINTKSDKLIIDLNNEWNPYKFLTIGASANITYSTATSPNTSWSELATYSSYIRPYTKLVDENGLTSVNTLSYGMQEVYSALTGAKSTDYNPITDAYDNYNKTINYSARINGFLRFKIIDGLTAEVGGNWTRGNKVYKSIAEADSYIMRLAYNNTTSVKNPANHYIPDGDMINETRSVNENWTLRTQLNYSQTFGKHRVSALAGNEVRRISYDNNTYETRFGYNSTAGSFTPVNIKDLLSGTDLTDMTIRSIMVSPVYGSYSISDNRFVSWYFNGSYEFDDRYLVSGSVREDLTNFFGTNPKYRHKPMWSVGGTWKLANEDFFDASWMNRLNLRASYGVNGNISLTEGPYLILYSGSYSSTTEGIPYGISSYPNNSLRWEKTKTTNVGVDVDILKNRFGFSFDYYYKKSTDILATDATDPTTGTSSMTSNVGSIQNRGIEISVHGTPVSTRSFQWDVVYNVSFNKNKVLKYNVSRPYATSWATTSAIHAEGYPMYGLFGYQYAGMNENGESLVYGADGNTKLISTVTADDVVYLGTAVPTADMSLTNTFSYKNWSLSFMFIAKFGNKYRKDNFNGYNITSRYVGQRWQQAGDEANTIYPSLKSYDSTERYYFPYCDVNIGNASYAKLRDLVLSYNFSKPLLSHIGMSDARIYLQARNLFRITGKSVDIDPETVDITSSSFSSLPRNAEYYVGLSFSF
jgi:TonB-linked SusC/RagA family outer membrane protein